MGRHSRKCWVLKLGARSSQKQQVGKEENAKKQRNVFCWLRLDLSQL